MTSSAPTTSPSATLSLIQFVSLLLLASTFTGYAQSGPTVSSYHIIDENEPALAGLLDSGDRFGRDFNPLGDLDLDGVPDFLVGARSDDDGATDAGAFYILFMNADGAVKSQTKVSATTGGLTEAGITLSESQFFGYAVTTVGDLNGDSIQDLAIGARRGGATEDGGAIFITFLNRDGTVKSVQPITNTRGNLGHTLSSSDFFGESAIFLGTINGLPTLAVSDAFNDDGGTNRGAIYILRLNPDGTAIGEQTVKISSTSGGFGTGLTNGDQFGGRDITPLGDIDGDGNLDLAVAAFGSDDGRGAIWILRLNADFTVKAKQKIGNGIGGLQAALSPDDNFGHTVTSPGDIDGDGVPDLISSANRSDLGGTDIGEVFFLFLNGDGTVKKEIRAGATTANLPLVLPDQGRFGRTLANLGDLANDGTICLAAGGGARSTGIIYLLFLTPEASPLLSDPRAIPGNILWLDGSDPDGDFILGGSFASGTTWIDKSSALQGNAIQASSTRIPTVLSAVYNGLSVVHFDGDDYMDLATGSHSLLRNTTGATLFAVARPTEAPGNAAYRVFMASTGTSSASTRLGFSFYDNFGTGLAGSGDTALNGRRLDTDAYQRINGGTASFDTLRQWTGTYDFSHARLQLFADGELLATASNFQTAGNTSDSDSLNLRLGADASLSHLRGFFTGDLAELILYDRILSSAEREKVEHWLALKWAEPRLQAKLSTGGTQLSWPVTPAPWTLKTSSTLANFTSLDAPPVQSNHQMLAEEPTAETPIYYRLGR